MNKNEHNENYCILCKIDARTAKHEIKYLKFKGTYRLIEQMIEAEDQAQELRLDLETEMIGDMIREGVYYDIR